MTERVSSANACDAAAEVADEQPATQQDVPARRLIPQRHGGALLPGGVRGHKPGGGRPKDALRSRMRTMLDATLDAMGTALAGERLSHEAEAALLADPRITALPVVAQRAVAEAARAHLTAVLSHRELIQFNETLARYGVGVQQERETTNTDVRYIVRLPPRAPAAMHPDGPVAVIPPPSRANGTETGG